MSGGSLVGFIAALWLLCCSSLAALSLLYGGSRMALWMFSGGSLCCSVRGSLVAIQYCGSLLALVNVFLTLWWLSCVSLVALWWHSCRSLVALSLLSCCSLVALFAALFVAPW